MTLVPDESNDLLERVRALGPLIEAHASEITAQRRLSDVVLSALKDAGVFRAVMPRAWGGLELDPLTHLAALEELAYRDGSTGWVAMICCDGGYFASYLKERAMARQLYADLDLLTAGWLAPAGSAERVPGGYRVTGRWSFGSGILHSERVIGGCLVWDGNKPVLTPKGQPEYMTAFLPRDAVRIHDVWFTTGLAGTSSNDYSVEGVFVPEAHTFNPFLPSGDEREAGPLYRYHGLLAAKMAGVCLGLLRRAIDELRALAETKNIAHAYRIQIARAAAEADLNACWGMAERTLGGVWATLTRREPLTLTQRAGVGAMCVWVTQTAKRAIDALCEEAGTAAAFTSNRLERVRRDMTMASHHVLGQRKTYELVGQMLLGHEPAFPLF